METEKEIVIVGAGPSGLFCADLLLQKGFKVDLYDHSSGPGKKFLIAGNGGLNLTHSEDLSLFKNRYIDHIEIFERLLKDFSPQDLRNWCHDLGVETFIGSSGRVFPKEMSAGKFLLAWIEKLKSFKNFQLHLKHKLVSLNDQKELAFQVEDEKINLKANTVILALGGSSWKKTGSDGVWKEIIEGLGIEVAPFQPMNCGFETEWSDFFKEKVDHSPIKHVEVSLKSNSIKGDLMLTPYGVEGGVIYGLSNFIRDEILSSGTATITVDLRPGLSHEALLKKLEKRAKKMTLSNHLRKSLNFNKNLFMLLKELLPQEELEEMNSLAKHIKGLKISLSGIRPIDEAISTSGGVCFSELTDSLESKSIPGLFFAGEMLDFQAPTGGYLLQGAFSTAYAIAKKFN